VRGASTGDLAMSPPLSSSKENCYILVNSKLKECEEILHSFIIKHDLDLKKVFLS
jgi:hypothetical protein